MATWDEINNEEEKEDENKEKANLALVASTFLNSKSKVDSDLDSEDVDGVLSKLTVYDLITFCLNIMDICQQKAGHMRIFKKQYDIL